MKALEFKNIITLLEGRQEDLALTLLKGFSLTKKQKEKLVKTCVKLNYSKLKLYGFMKKANIQFEKNIYEFGVHSSKSANKEKELFLSQKNGINMHYYSYSVKSKKTGYTYNILRGLTINIL